MNSTNHGNVSKPAGHRRELGRYRNRACTVGSVLIGIAAVGGCSSSQSGVDGNGAGGGFSVTGSQGGNGTGSIGSINGTGSTGNNGTGSSNNGTNTTTSTGTGTTTPAPAGAGCSIGSQGCYCDTIGGCVAGLACNSGICCDSSTGNCNPSSSTGTSTSTSTYTGSSTGVGGSGTGTGTTVVTNPGSTVCTPGVIGTLVTDCGYPYSSNYPLTSTVFNESSVLVGIVPTGGSYAVVRVFYGDEHALTLGVRSVVVKSSSGSSSKDYAVSPLSNDPDAVNNPATGSNILYGDQAGLDPSLRPMWPALFITDITNDPNSRAGDWQYGGRPYNPTAVYGTWKSAVRTVDTTVSPAVSTITPDADPAKNNWTLGTGADPVPSTIGKNEGYGAEVVWNLALIPGHSYRVQAMVHDGDQNKVGGDSGEACVNFCAGGDTEQPDGGYHVPNTGQGGQPQCQEGSSPCGPGTAISASDCPLGYVCANGCCTSTIG